MVQLIKNSMLFVILVVASLVNAELIDTLSENYTQKVIIEAKWGDKPSEFGRVKAGFWEGPTCFNIDDSGNIYIMDFYNARIQCYDEKGKFIKAVLLPKRGDKLYVTKNNILTSNKKAVKHYSPGGGKSLAIDDEGNFYISILSWNNKTKKGAGKPLYTIIKYDSSGKMRLKYPIHYDSKSAVEFSVKILNEEVIAIPGASDEVLAVGNKSNSYLSKDYKFIKFNGENNFIYKKQNDSVVLKYSKEGKQIAKINIEPNQGGGAFSYLIKNDIIYQMISNDTGLFVYKYVKE